MSATYLQSRPDRPLHLAIWVADRAEHQQADWLTSGGWRALCGEVGDGWIVTGPWAENWQPHPVCKQCLWELAELTEAADPR